jgi:Restriction endonuclease
VLPTAFHVGECYSNDELRHALGVGNAGGVRSSVGNDGEVQRLVVMTSVPTTRQATENPYHDRIEGDILVYTGAGREGDQTLAGVNKRIPQQLSIPFPIYGFIIVSSRRDRAIGPKRWRFLGLLEYLRHYRETQVDTRGQLRQAWIFEFRIHSEPTITPVDHDSVISSQLIAAARERDRSEIEDREVVSATAAASSKSEKEVAARIEEVRSRLLGIAPERFEHLIKDLLLQSGFEKVSVTKYSQDGGIDVNALAGPAMWPVRGMHLQVQAKRWLHTVGRKEVAELRGSLQPFARGAVVTTSHFSKAALLEANESGKNPIILVDGYQFASAVEALQLSFD